MRRDMGGLADAQIDIGAVRNVLRHPRRDLAQTDPRFVFARHHWRTDNHLAALGLILPALLGVAPVMVPVTAVCWVLLMVGAMITHGRRGEFGFVLLNLTYLALAAFVAWGRFGPGSFTG